MSVLAQQSKQDSRDFFRRQIARHLVGAPKDEWDRQISNSVNQILSSSADLVAAYRALPGEPDLWSLFAPQFGRWVFPKVKGERLEFYRAPRAGAFEEGHFGILEPRVDECEVMPLKACAAVLLPGLGFDRSGRRLGRGKGFYDRALADYSGQRIGVCYSFQVSNENLPSLDHDMHVDLIVTEKYILRPERRGVQPITGSNHGH